MEAPDDQGTLIQRWTERLGRQIPGAVAVILRGSSVAGTMGPWSDVDFDVLTSVDGDDRYLAFLEQNTSTSKTGLPMSQRYGTPRSASIGCPPGWTIGVNQPAGHSGYPSWR